MKTVNAKGLKNNPNEALATALFKAGDLSLTRAAELADMTLAGFIAHVSKQGIPVISQSDEEVESDMDTLEEWLTS